MGVKGRNFDLLQDTSKPVMCSYKGVRVSFEVWGLQSKVESYAHKVRIIITKFEFKANVQIYKQRFVHKIVIIFSSQAPR